MGRVLISRKGSWRHYMSIGITTRVQLPRLYCCCCCCCCCWRRKRKKRKKKKKKNDDNVNRYFIFCSSLTFQLNPIRSLARNIHQSHILLSKMLRTCLRIFFCLSVCPFACLSVCLWAGILKKIADEFFEILGRNKSWNNEP